MTSECIGELSSPTCIVDTMIACDAWSPDRPRLFDYVDESWIGLDHPVCDVLRIQPGHGGYAPRSFGIGTAIGGPKYVLYYYKVVPFRVTEETCGLGGRQRQRHSLSGLAGRRRGGGGGGRALRGAAAMPGE